MDFATGGTNGGRRSVAQRSTLTTGQAAALSSVNADTVLKWVKKGLLKATRTTGGHFRIEKTDLEALLAARAATPNLVQAGETQGPMRCWEHFAQGGVVQPECKECVVYQIRASWCFKVGTPGCELGQAKHYCGTSCDQCLYYQRVRGRTPKVLIVSPDAGMIQRLSSESIRGMEVGFARNGYEASAVLCTFRPDFVIVDEVLLNTTEPDLLDYLACDSRVHGTQTGIAVEDPLTGPYPSGPPANAKFLMKKPLAAVDLQTLKSSYAVEVLPEGESVEPEEKGAASPR